jgi:hypothetical protein
MAGKIFTKKIREAAKFLATPTAQAARGYLDLPLESTLKVLDCFADGLPHSYEEIAEMIGMHDQTVRQIIRALDEGGYSLTFTYAEMKANTGRKPVAVQLKVKTKK